MNAGVIELVFHLSPCVFEEILPFLIRLEVKPSLKVHALLRARHQVNLSDVVLANKNILYVLVGNHSSSETFHEFACGPFLQVNLPEVVSILIPSLIIQSVAIRREQHVAEASRVACKSYDTVAAVDSVEFDSFHLFHFNLSPIFVLTVLLVFLCLLLGFFLFLFFLFLFLSGLVVAVKFLLAHAEAFVGVKVEEHKVDVVFSSPAAVAAESGTVATEQHSLSAEHPFRVAFVVAAIGEVKHLTVVVSANEGNVSIVPSTNAYV